MVSSIPQRYMGLVETNFPSTTSSTRYIEIFELFSECEQNEAFSQAMSHFVTGNYDYALIAFASMKDAVSNYFANACTMALQRAKEMAAHVTMQEALLDRNMLQRFEQFAAKEKSTENIALWRHIEKFRANPSPALAQTMVEQFLSESGIHRVNVNNAWYAQFCNLMQQDQPLQADMFDKVQAEIMLLMLDTWKRFVKLPDFDKIILKSAYFAEQVPAHSFTSLVKQQFFK